MKLPLASGIIALALVVGLRAQEPSGTPADMATTKTNLLEIGKALDAYRTEKGDYPEWLSGLVPKYLDAKLLLCPADGAGGDPKVPEAIDPEQPCSYIYEFHPAWKTAKLAEVGMFGDVTPIVRCLHFTDENGELVVLNLSVAGEIYPSRLVWQEEEKAVEGLKESFKKNLQNGEKEGNSNLITRIIFELPKPVHAELESLADAALETNAENPVAHKLKGLLALLRGDVNDSLVSLEKATAKLTKDTDLFVITARVYAGMERTDDALKAFETARKLQPDAKLLGWTYPTFAELYVKAGRTRDAETLLAQYKLAMDPDDVNSRLTLGDIYVAMERFADAAKVFEALDTEYPDSQEILERLAYVYEKSGNEAKHREIQIRLDPGSALIGQDAPAFSGKDLEGKTVALENLRGKVVLLNFWASW